MGPRVPPASGIRRALYFPVSHLHLLPLIPPLLLPKPPQGAEWGVGVGNPFSWIPAFPVGFFVTCVSLSFCIHDSLPLPALSLSVPLFLSVSLMGSVHLFPPLL